MNTSLEMIVGILLALVAVYYVLRPVLAPTRRMAAVEAAQAAEVLEDLEDDLSPRTVALRALKEIEFDRATGKLSDDDYQAMLTRYTKEAVEALRAAEAPAAAAEAASGEASVETAAVPVLAGANGGGGNGHAPQSAVSVASGSAEDEVERLISEARQAARGGGRKYCSNCGALLEGSGRFCVECGTRV
jgi:membrane protease subunit (stomatin/prohibitin family)